MAPKRAAKPKRNFPPSNPPLSLLEILRQRKLKYRSHELVMIREHLIGSAALIDLIMQGAGPEQLSSALSQDTDGAFKDAIVTFNTSVTQVAFGHGVLWERGELEPTPGAPASILTGIKSTRPDYTRLHHFVEHQRTVGGVLDQDPVWHSMQYGLSTWPLRLAKALDDLNNRFIAIFAKEEALLRFNGEDEVLRSSKAVLDKVLAQVTILPTHILEESRDPNVAPTPVPHRLFHEELRKRGAVVLAGLGRAAREEGNALFQKGNAMTHDSEARERCYLAACEKYALAARAPEEQCVAPCNAAAVHLVRKDWKQAIAAAQTAVHAGKRRDNDAVQHGMRRAAFINVLLTGRAYALPETLHRRFNQTAEEQKADRSVAFKCLMRLARGHAGLCRELLEGFDDVDAPRDEAERERDKACEHYTAAQLVERDDKTPAQEMDALKAEVQACMQQWGGSDVLSQGPSPFAHLTL